MFASKDTLLTRPSGYNIARSVRFRSSASAYLNRTPATAGNRKTWTYSGWIKRGKLGADQTIFGAGYSTSPWFILQFDSGDNLDVSFTAGVSGGTLTSSVYRDPAAWYHIVCAVDTTQATASNRMKLYVNGVQVTSFSSTSYPSQNTDYQVNNTVQHYISNGAWYFDGYMAEVQLIDGQALTPSSFGETDSITGVWKAKKYGGTYGTNGFYLNFSDNSNNTAATIGKDYSGNGNNWTPNNISVTAGTTYDSMTDVPTLTSATAANYPTMNPLQKGSAVTLSDGNLLITVTAGSAKVLSTMGMASGKYYCEMTINASTFNYGNAGLATFTTSFGVGSFLGDDTTSWCYAKDGNIYTNGTGTAYGNTYTVGDVIGVAFDADNGKLYFSKNGTWQNSGDPTTSTNPAVTGLSNGPYCFGQGASPSAVAVNFGQRPFSYTPPTGFVALNTYNLPASTITNGAAYMAATTYTGNGSTQSISNAVGSTSFQPDFVWIKLRNQAGDYHNLFDSVRGVYKRLFSNDINSENTNTDTLTAFNSNGFSVGTNGNVNTNAINIIGWQWKAGGTSSSNTNGSITSTVSAGATQGFSVVTYSGNGTNSATVGHGLGVTPSMVILKERTGGDEAWAVWHTSLGANNYFLRLNGTDTVYTAFTNRFTGFSSTTFTLGNPSNTETNGSGYTYVAYCFAAVAGYSAFGKYTGNGTQGAGPFVYTGFRPRYVLIKNINGAYDWHCFDTARGQYNYSGSNILKPNTSDAELTARNDVQIDFLSNGFRLIGNDIGINQNGSTHIYITFAENPFRNALAF